MLTSGAARTYHKPQRISLKKHPALDEVAEKSTTYLRKQSLTKGHIKFTATEVWEKLVDTRPVQIIDLGADEGQLFEQIPKDWINEDH